MLSLTGFGSASVLIGSASVTVEARAVNQRFLDVRVRLPQVLSEHAAVLEEVARRHLVRGRVELAARVEGSLHANALLDRERAKLALSELQALRDELQRDEPIPLALLAAVPGLFVERPAVPVEALRAALQQATLGACQALSAMRRNEGRALAADLGARVATLASLNARMQANTERLREAHRERLRARISGLLAGTGVALDPSRLEQELALLADRGDVSEEMTRLASHCRQFEELLQIDDEPLGRRLEFLLQEMVREVNTLGSKVNDLELTGAVLQQKAELERMREQVQNVL